MIRQAHRVLFTGIATRIRIASFGATFNSDINSLITSQIVPPAVKFAPPNSRTDDSTEQKPNAATVHQELCISNFVTSHDDANHERWGTLVDQLHKIQRGEINAFNIDYKIMGSCARLKKLDLARSYLTFVKQRRKFDGAIACEFLKLCYNCRSLLTDQDLKHVKKFTEFLKRKYVVVDFYIGEGIIKGLLLQNEIDESFRMFEEIKKTSYVNEDTYSSLVMYLLETACFGRAVALMKEMKDFNFALPEEICMKWIEMSKGNREQLDAMLRSFRDFNYMPRKTVYNGLRKTYAQLPDSDKLLGQYGVVSESGQCSICRSHLEQINLTNTDYKKLKNLIINRVLIGGDIYKNTMPYELEKFHRLMDCYAPFDIIIDGLNIAYITEETGAAIAYVRVIEKVLKRFAKQNYKMMFIGKWHMRKWPGLLDMIRQYEARYFFVEDISTDDLYIIGATLHSGVNARYVTRDSMRKEFQLVDSETTALFYRWRQRHQIRLKYERRTKEIVIIEPTTHEMVVQRAANGGWHIPCFDESANEFAKLTTQKWLCLYPAAVK